MGAKLSVYIISMTTQTTKKYHTYISRHKLTNNNNVMQNHAKDKGI